MIRSYIGSAFVASMFTAVPCLAQLDVRPWSLVDPYDRWSITNPSPTSCRMDETATSSTVGPGWVVSPFVLSANASFGVTIQPLANGDDDLIGIAFSYQSNARFLLLDWKQTTQSFNWGDTVVTNDDIAEAGTKIKKVNGSWTRDGLWGGTDGIGVSTLAGPIAPGWVDNAVYRLEFVITPGRVVVRRDGAQVFDLSDPSVGVGRVAFFSFSQDDVVFSNVTASGLQCVADVDDGTGSGTPDGGVTIDDLLYYLGLFQTGVIGADIDDGSGTGTPDGGVTIDDLLYFLQRFADGC